MYVCAPVTPIVINARQRALEEFMARPPAPPKDVDVSFILPSYTNVSDSSPIHIFTCIPPPYIPSLIECHLMSFACNSLQSSMDLLSMTSYTFPMAQE